METRTNEDDDEGRKTICFLMKNSFLLKRFSPFFSLCLTPRQAAPSVESKQKPMWKQLKFQQDSNYTSVRHSSKSDFIFLQVLNTFERNWKITNETCLTRFVFFSFLSSRHLNKLKTFEVVDVLVLKKVLLVVKIREMSFRTWRIQGRYRELGEW